VGSYGISIPTKTPKGNPSLGKATVEDLSEQYPDNEPLRILKEVANTSNVTTFLRSLTSFVDADGFVHPDFNTLGAVTGRWTVTDPAIQTVAGINRSVFVPREGRVFVSADLGQIEPRVAVGLAGEQKLIPALLSGSDVYSAGASLAFGAAFTEKQRKQIKRVILGTLYASGVATLVKQARLLDGWLDADHKTVAGVRELWKRAAPEITAYAGYLSMLKQVDLDSGRWIPQEVGREYKAINSMCQGTARDVLMERFELLSRTMDGYLIATMHDEILFDVPKDGLVEAVKVIREVMECGYNGIPTPADIAIYPDTWGGEGIPWEEYRQDG
jgi:DNA polymerase-1